MKPYLLAPFVLLLFFSCIKEDTKTGSSIVQSTNNPTPNKEETKLASVHRNEDVGLDDKKVFLAKAKNERIELLKFKAYGKEGLYDKDTNVIIPFKFDAIHNYGFFPEPWIEIRNGKSYALFNVENKRLTHFYQMIYPINNNSTSNNFIALGKDKNGFFGIDENGDRIIENNLKLEDYFSYELLADSHPLGYQHELNKELKWLGPKVNDEHEGGWYQFVDYYTPSVWTSFKTIDEQYTFFISSEEYFEGGLEEIKVENIESRTIGEQIKTFALNFYERGIGARGEYQSNEHHIQAQDEAGNFVDYLKFYNGGGEVCNIQVSIKHLENGLIEVVSGDYDYNSELDFYKKTTFHKLQSNGKIIPIKANRAFPIASVRYLTADDFKGCYTDLIEDRGDGNVVLRTHMNIEELDIMRNEIFADYGYRFKSEKWKTYFEQLEWYKPQFDNVDDRLTEVEKENIKLILEMKAKMEGNEDQYTQPTYKHWVAAG